MINKTNKGQTGAWQTHQDTPQDTHMKRCWRHFWAASVESSAETRKRCAPVKYFMHLSGAFCKTFLHFLHANLFAQVVLPAHDDGMRIVDCGLYAIASPLQHHTTLTHTHLAK